MAKGGRNTILTNDVSSESLAVVPSGILNVKD